MKQILIVEDDKEIRKLLADALTSNDYAVTEAADGAQATRQIKEGTFDMILMDMMLPFKPGNELVAELRNLPDESRRHTPVIVISAKSQKETRLEMLKIGADDYIIKPFDLDEVLVRMEVVMRRSAGDSAADLSHKGLTLLPAQMTATFQDEPIKLTAKEYGLLELFIRHPEKTYTKAALYEAVWEEEYAFDDNTVNVHMSNLRSKLKKATGDDMIETVWGIGYKLK